MRSPLTLGAIWSGLVAASSERAAARSRRHLVQWLESLYPTRSFILTDSGTSALALAIAQSIRANAGPVALPAYGCFDLATAIDAAGAEFVFYDVDPATLGPDAPSLGRALAHGARCVVIAHQYGVPIDPESIELAVRSAGAIVIDDAAQGWGARVGGRPLGSLGDLGILSFGRGKGVTGGRGGALILPSGPSDGADSHTGDALRPYAGSAYIDLAKLLLQWALARPRVYALPAHLPLLRLGETLYRAPQAPAGIGRVALGTLGVTAYLQDAEAAVRRRNAERLRSGWHSTHLNAPVVPPSATAGFLRCPAVASAVVARRGREASARRLGIMPGYPQALCDLSGFGERAKNREERFDGARYLAERLLTFPCHSALSERDLVALERWGARRD